MTIKYSLLLFKLIVIVTLVMSCAPEATPPNTPAADASPTAEPATSEPTSTPAPVSPSVIDTQPAAGAELPLEAPIQLTFDQPMNRQSVERAFAIQPGASADGTFDWLDDRTVQFTMSEGLQRGQRYEVRLVESAASDEGLSLSRPFAFHFSTIGFLEVTAVQPADETAEVAPDTSVTVVFNRPVVALSGIDEAGSRPDPLTFTPPVAGQGEWLNTAIYQFTPDDGFTPATEYQARVAQGLTDATGNAVLEGDFEWTFTTVAPAVVASIPQADDNFVSTTPVISVAFNQPMNRQSVEQNFSLTNEETGDTLSGEFVWSAEPLTIPRNEEDGYYEESYGQGDGPATVGVETVVFTPDEPLALGQSYQINIPEGTQATLGEDALMPESFTASFTVIPAPAIDRTRPANGADQVDPWQSLEVTFNAPMNPDSLILGENLFIEPAISATQVYSYWWQSNTQLGLNFPTDPSSSYTVTLGPSLENRDGQQLDSTEVIAWQTRAANPGIHLHGPGQVAVYNAYTDTLVFVNMQNIGRADFLLSQISEEEFITINSDWQAWEEFQPTEESEVASWSLEVNPPLNENRNYRVDLGARAGYDSADGLPSGLYYLEVFGDAESIYPEAQGADFYSPVQKQLLVVSPYNLTLKRSNSELLAWVTDLQTGEPISDLPVEFYEFTELPQTLGQQSTDANGVAFIEYESSQEYYRPRYAIAGDPANGQPFAVASSDWQSGISRWEFNNVTVQDYQTPYQAHFYTERPIYRPGQMVYFKGILRRDNDAHYRLPTASDTVDITIYDGQGKEIYIDELPISEMGTFHGSVALAEDAGLGIYSVDMAYYDEQPFNFSGSFQVAAYRKPEYQVEVVTDKPEYLQGETIQVSVEAQFFSGGPVSNAAVKWTLLSDDYAFRYQGDGFYDFTDYDFSRRNVNNYYSSAGEAIAEGEGQTDGDGRFIFEVEADIADKIASQRFTIDVVIEDLNNQTVARQAEAVVHQGLIYVGLQPAEYVGSANEANQVNVLTVDWDSQPVADQEVQVVFAEHNWYSVQKQYEDGSYYWDSVVENLPVFTTTVNTDRDGLASAEFTPENGGIYKVTATATDSEGHEVRSSTFMWVSGSDYVNWRQENNDRLELVTNQKEYEVGDTATILIPHPYDGPVKALISWERGRIYSHTVVTLETNSEQIDVPITEDMIPNMYISVVVVDGAAELPYIDEETGEAIGLPSFKVGYANLPINNEAKLLNISLKPNKGEGERYEPQESVTYDVEVTDAAGEPVQAELSLALVDKAVLSLAPETPGQLRQKFWETRGLGVNTAGGLTMAIDRVNLAIAPYAKGGGGGIEFGFGDVRGDFRETALWVADFMTDEAGQGTVETTLPDNLTTWTLTGKGVTGAETLVGEASVEIVSSKPLLVRPVAPRFLVVGDEARMGLIVQNNTPDALSVETLFEATGVTVEPLGETTVTVEGGQRVRVDYQVTVLEPLNDNQLNVTLGAKAAQLGDAMTFDIPVYHSVTPETVATAGVLDEAGSRIETIALPSNIDPTQGELTVNVDHSLAAGMRDGLDYLEHFRYECTEQTVSRFLPNVFTYRAYDQLNLKNPDLEERLPSLVSLGLQRLYSQQHIDGGWGWWVADDSNANLTAYVLLGLVEAQGADFSVEQQVIDDATEYLRSNLLSPAKLTESWQANQQAFVLYVLAEAGNGDLGRAKALFKKRDQLDMFGRAYLALAMYLLDEQTPEIDTLLNDLTDGAVVSATGAHWEEAQVDYFAMNTDTRSTAIIIAALSRIQPEHSLLPQAVRWLMSIRENGGHWETTQETAWAIIGLTDWMVATGELEADYSWQVSLNGESLSEGLVDQTNLAETTRLQIEVGNLLADTVNRLAFERDATTSAAEAGKLYYTAFLNYYKPVEDVKALNRGLIVSRQYRLAPEGLADEVSGKPVTEATVGDTIEVKLTLVAPNDLHYVVLEDPLPAGTEGIDQSLATTSVVGQRPSLERTDRQNPWGRGYGWWYFSHTELRDDRAVLFATYLPKGTYEYTYYVRASLVGEFRVRPTHAEQMYFPEVFGRGDGALFTVTPE